MSHTATCEADVHAHAHPDLEDPAVDRGVAPPPPHRSGTPTSGRSALLALAEVRWAAIALIAFVLAAAARAGGAPSAIEGALLVACYAAGGWEPAREGLRALRHRTLDVDLLMIVAALAAAAIGQAMDGGLLIVIFATSGALEAVATRRTRDAVRSLLTLSPERATRLSDDGRETEVDASQLVPGDVVLVRPGERVGGDGVVLDGVSDVDESTMTGEPLPVAKSAGDAVLAGTLNGTGALRVRVETAAGDSVVARIVAMVTEASETKAATQLFIERVEQRYSFGVVAGTLALLVVPLALGSELHGTLLRAMTFMIVASPCALVLATMPPLLSAIANAGRRGVLVKSAVVMEQLGHTGVVAFDKTGTITEGAPALVAVHPAPGGRLDDDEVLALAAAAERRSEHPIGRAIVAAAIERRVPVPDASAFESRAGFGVTATVGSAQVTVGRPRPAAGGAVEQLQREGHTAVTVSVDGAVVGVLGLADRLRPSAGPTVVRLAGLTGRRPVLLTGDNEGSARRVAAQVGIEDVRSRLLPDEKVAAVRELGLDGAHVTVVGDGVNDAPALAAAGTGVAMGRRGSDLALETADVIIVGDELAKVPSAIQLSRRARRVVNQNLVIASAVIVTLVAVDLFGHLPLPLGVAGHEGSTVVVGLNGLRLLSRRSWAREA